jgi:hypothetical protein
MRTRVAGNRRATRTLRNLVRSRKGLGVVSFMEDLNSCLGTVICILLEQQSSTFLPKIEWQKAG